MKDERRKMTEGERSAIFSFHRFAGHVTPSYPPGVVAIAPIRNVSDRGGREQGGWGGGMGEGEGRS